MKIIGAKEAKDDLSVQRLDVEDLALCASDDFWRYLTEVRKSRKKPVPTAELRRRLGI